ncbi:hypothetical protein HNO88_002776 [Novosphingobium chloroacetimidivorans]|uniref:Uncharacterized protein n=1 Tax=Novosphingobium chloroacetimidivorans TaxID=1428314 RepID=A0A7W7NXS9_9SPHN|nr:hypothetical protein [Novosphingobium chloroacetimidivorans]MBB4859447.1 hypothetical protein [Novosphingobium chloroacetimidivorans]
MGKKVTTRAEAVRVAYFIAEKMGSKSVDGAKAKFSEKWDGKWRKTTYEIEHPDFSIYATRTKHSRDQRIRDAYNSVDGLLAFAIWAARNFPASVTWIDELRDPALVRGTMDARARKEIVLPPRLGLVPLSKALHALDYYA